MEIDFNANRVIIKNPPIDVIRLNQNEEPYLIIVADGQRPTRDAMIIQLAKEIAGWPGIDTHLLMEAGMTYHDAARVNVEVQAMKRLRRDR